ncbi:MAG TPA: glycoside hydrolase family 6 protein [Polyangia bacterium]|nr:glycoside hydrolase family 6 protein [Polyangia bacterium]
MPSRHFDRSIAAAVALTAALAGCAGPTGEARPAETPAVSPVPVPTTPAAPAGENPFLGARLYVNPDYVRAVQALELAHPRDAALLKKMEPLPTAIWLSWIADTRELPRTLDDARRQQQADGRPVVPVFVVYDLPGRDCAAEASAGELAPDAAGEARYQHEFIDAIAAAFRAHPDQRVVAVLEPDSLSNLVTNLDRPRCHAAAAIYKRGIAYAISKLSLPNVFLYLEAAHAGWLGFPKNIGRAAALYKEVLTMGGGPERVRGFALDVSNYDPAVDPAKTPRDRTSAASDETGYAADLARALGQLGVTGKRFVIDTGRDGQAYIRSVASSWCNVRGAGLGERPRAAPSPLVDAYLYIKVPGESDGTSDPNAPRFDQTCAGDDATPGAPQAGKMFDAYLIDLLKNASPPL